MKMRIVCPHCGATYRLDVRWTSREAICAQCNNRFAAQPANVDNNSPQDTPPHTPPLTDPPEELFPKMPADIKLDPNAILAPPTPQPAPFDTPAELPPDSLLDQPDPSHAFRRDLLRFLLPYRSLPETISFLVILALCCLLPFLDLLPGIFCAGLLAQLIIGAILVIFCFTIVSETARGADELPYVNTATALLEDFWGSIIIPITDWFGALLYCQLPTLAASLAIYLLAGKQALDNPASQALTASLLVLGFALWPMVILILAFDNIPLLLRPHIILRAIIAIWAPYLLACLCLLLACAIFFSLHHFSPQLPDQPSLWPAYLALTVGLRAVDLVLFIYAMRVIGLLYRHYQHRLPWADPDRPKHPLEK